VSRGHEEITLANSTVIGDGIRNFSRLVSGSVALSTSVSIGYDTPWRQVRAILQLAAERTEGVLREPAPIVLETALSTFAIDYQLVAHGAPGVPRAALMSRLHQQILDAFNEHGVQIMTPAFEGQPDRPVIVQRNDWFMEPAAVPDAGAKPSSGQVSQTPRR
jgi:small-conductance mechanosensitive channel